MLLSKDDWLKRNEQCAEEGLQSVGRSPSFMAMKMHLVEAHCSFTATQLKDAAEKATVHTFGWPIAAFLTREEYKPKPTNDGIMAEIQTGPTYDYWAIRDDGTFYFLGSLFEETRRRGYIFLDTRIIRITEALMYAENLYSNLGVDPKVRINIDIRHGGLKGKILGVANPSRFLFDERTSAASESRARDDVETSVEEMRYDPVGVVKRFADPLFEKFDFFKVSDDTLKEIVLNYRDGKII